ncbi:MAG: recombinase family protein [Prochlorotrichaceae cyanobacterium]
MLWICGHTRSGKTTRLVQEFCQWLEVTPNARSQTTQAIVLASTSDNQLALRDALVSASPYSCTPYTASPLGFIQREVFLFWPLLAQHLNLSVLFPLRLRSETEQELAVQFWQRNIDRDNPKTALPPKRLERSVRNELDLFFLALSSGLSITEASCPEGSLADKSSFEARLQDHAAEAEALGVSELRGETWIAWRNWCLERGFLTYSIITELFYRWLLPDPQYQTRFRQRFSAIFADDVDEYPGAMLALFEYCREIGLQGIFTENPRGSVRLGFGADPCAFSPFAETCQRVTLPDPSQSLATASGPLFLQLLQPQPPSLGFEWDLQETLSDVSPIQVLQTTLRGELLRQISNLIHQGVQQGQVQPADIALITPGLDSITRYSFQEMLSKQGIDLFPLAEQRPLIEVPLVGALLTLMALVYDGLGYLVDRDRVAEMLTVLSDRSFQGEATIDPVRAGLLADQCYVPDPHHPQLLDYHHCPRWDRLGAIVTPQYDRIRHWISQQRQALQQTLLDPPLLLDRALNTFFTAQRTLSYAQLAALRELMETASHYWEVQQRLGIDPQNPDETRHALQTFIQLLRQGTIAANPYPLNPAQPQNAVTLTTVFQYRLNHCRHPWQFWLDVGSPRWLLKSGGLSGADWFLSRIPESLQGGELLSLGELRVERNLLDLLGRLEGAQPRLFLCHSDLSTSGQEQIGPLLPLVYAGFPSCL